MVTTETAVLAADPATPPPFVVSSYTLGTTVGFRDRVRAAAAAGYDGIGLRAENYWAAELSGLDGAAMAEIAGAAGVPVREVEYVTDWGSGADRTTEQRRKERAVFEMARAFGVRHVNAGLLQRLPHDAITASFAALCDRAGELTVALEFMPYSGVPDLTAAWRVVGDAGRPNGALIVDVWHWARAGQSTAALDGVPADRIVSFQLCDVRAEPMQPARAESLGHRLPPGHGHADAVGLTRALRAHGVHPRVVSVEVISDELVSLGVDHAARVSADAARDVLRRAAA